MSRAKTDLTCFEPAALENLTSALRILEEITGNGYYVKGVFTLVDSEGDNPVLVEYSDALGTYAVKMAP